MDWHLTNLNNYVGLSNNTPADQTFGSFTITTLPSVAFLVLKFVHMFPPVGSRTLLS